MVFARVRKNFAFCELIFAKSWAFHAAPKKMVCKRGLSQKVGLQKAVLSPAHFEKVHVFCGHGNGLSQSLACLTAVGIM